MKFPSLNKSKSCLICEKKCSKIYSTVKYRYEDGLIGEVYVCEECSKEHNLDENIINEQPI